MASTAPPSRSLLSAHFCSRLTPLTHITPSLHFTIRALRKAPAAEKQALDSHMLFYQLKRAFQKASEGKMEAGGWGGHTHQSKPVFSCRELSRRPPMAKWKLGDDA
uniref:Uncharacterized protein n=1 Tax=Micrurus spixii TaxID=129469 RepID=A0A2D4NC38_9SAUR